MEPRTLRVLVADDDRDTVHTLTVLLEGHGYTVHGVHSGKDVLVVAPIFRPDALILDIAVPGMSGYAVARAIRHSFADLRRPLLIGISGVWKDAPDRMVAEEIGFDHYLAKPADPEEVLRLLESARR